MPELSAAGRVQISGFAPTERFPVHSQRFTQHYPCMLKLHLGLAAWALSLVACGEAGAPADSGGLGGKAGTGGKAGGIAGGPASGGAGAAASGGSGFGAGGSGLASAGMPGGGMAAVGFGGKAPGNAGSNASAGTMGGAPAGGVGGAMLGAGRPGLGGAGSGGSGSGGMPGATDCVEVTPVPDEVRTRLELDPFYEKHVDAHGLSVLGSSAPSDESLLLACKALNNMLSESEDVRAELIRRKARFAIIGKDEGTADIPEYGYRDASQADIDYINQRARGLGGLVASCGEENILCLAGDRYPRESICVHEFSHTITTYGAYTALDSFQDDLQDAFDSALASGILDDTYRGSNLQEYWAEGVQDWYDTNDWASPPNGIHNDVNTRVELAEYDPTLYALVASLFPESTGWGDCRAD